LEILLIFLAAGLALLVRYLNSPTVIGAEGERRVNSTLRRKLDERDHILLEDLTLPTAQGTTQIDHVVLSRFGIFVIETKNMSGWIFGSYNQPRWTQVKHRHKSQFQNPVRQNYHHVKVVQGLLGVRMDQIENLVAFVGSAEPRTEMPRNVFWSRHELFDYIDTRSAIQFTEGEIRNFAKKLRSSALEANRETRRAHVNHVRQKVAQKETDPTKCPRCGASMSARKNRKTGQSFLGCSRYPQCRGTRQIE